MNFRILSRFLQLDYHIFGNRIILLKRLTYTTLFTGDQIIVLFQVYIKKVYIKKYNKNLWFLLRMESREEGKYPSYSYTL